MAYIKTTLGSTALAQRDPRLSSKQRQLLFLIGTEDFGKLAQHSQQRLFNAELIQSLEALGFIQSNNAASNTVINRITESSNTEIQISQVETEDLTDVKEETKTVSVHFATQLELNDVQNMMITTLQQYSGLLAHSLIQQIQQCQNKAELKRYQMPWLTLLQETRLPAQELHLQMKQLQFFFQLQPS
ncbi:hypothetical protein [Acinetobacter sp. MD2]|uniref:hypothetical protein n=1 Tax=Acinetobacter sp. MD2 TaxID=2600066 RepID=UPI002D1E82ED|nr:hypothetical protein [Acinetobacter sp. MD2]MEB3767208.1 hypothetical protein [Acinetobacter sp. MD2]